MKIVIRFVLPFLLVVVASILFRPDRVGAKTISDIQGEIDKYTSELEKLGVQAKTLSNQILQFNAQIKLTGLKISKTEEKIILLGGRINQLESSLDSLTKAFSSRAKETYKISRIGGNFFLIVSAGDISEAFARYHYLKKIQESDQSLLIRLQEAQDKYKVEKVDQEDLAKTLQQEKNNLSKQKKERENLLAVTKNDEKKYQELLISARAELAVTLGQGKETFLRDVKEGEKVGTIIGGASGCSSGTHLHLEFHRGENIVSPEEFLRPISLSYYPGYDTSYYGAVSPRGSWNWPLNEPIQVNQGFGSHGYAKVFYPGGVHNGIDITSDDKSVKAVKPGKLYGGSYQCGGRYSGTLLYAKIDQGDSVTAWYLHMIPQ